MVFARISRKTIDLAIKVLDFCRMFVFYCEHTIKEIEIREFLFQK